MNTTNRIHKLRAQLAAGLLVLVAIGVAVVIARRPRSAGRRGREPSASQRNRPSPSATSVARGAPPPRVGQAAEAPFARIPAAWKQDLALHGDGRCTRPGQYAQALISQPLPGYGFDEIAALGQRILVGGSVAHARDEDSDHFILLTNASGHVQWGYRVLGTLPDIALGASGPVVAVDGRKASVVGLDWSGRERWRVVPADSSAKGPRLGHMIVAGNGAVVFDVEFSGRLRVGQTTLGGDAAASTGRLLVALDEHGTVRWTRPVRAIVEDLASGPDTGVSALLLEGGSAVERERYLFRHGRLWPRNDPQRLREITLGEAGEMHTVRRVVAPVDHGAVLAVSRSGSALAWSDGTQRWNGSPKWNPQVVVQRVDASGRYQWRKRWPASTIPEVDVAMFPDGELVLLGTGDWTTLTPTKGLESVASSPYFVASLASDGKVRWLVPLYLSSAMAISGDRLYVVGDYLGAWYGLPSPFFPYVEPGKSRKTGDVRFSGYVVRICR